MASHMKVGAALTMVSLLSAAFLAGAGYGQAQPAKTKPASDAGKGQSSGTATNGIFVGKVYRAGALGNLELLTKEVRGTADELGYTATLTPGDYGTLDVLFQKSGQTAPLGPIGTKWQQRETVGLTYVPVDSGLRIVSSKRIVEQKAPIGPWRKVEESDQVPTDVLQAVEKGLAVTSATPGAGG